MVGYLRRNVFEGERDLQGRGEGSLTRKQTWRSSRIYLILKSMDKYEEGGLILRDLLTGQSTRTTVATLIGG